MAIVVGAGRVAVPVHGTVEVTNSAGLATIKVPGAVPVGWTIEIVVGSWIDVPRYAA